MYGHDIFFFLSVPVPSQKREGSRVYVLGVSILHLSLWFFDKILELFRKCISLICRLRFLIPFGCAHSATMMTVGSCGMKNNNENVGGFFLTIILYLIVIWIICYNYWYYFISRAGSLFILFLEVFINDPSVFKHMSSSRFFRGSMLFNLSFYV
jgi:hypothetical protein